MKIIMCSSALLLLSYCATFDILTSSYQYQSTTNQNFKSKNSNKALLNQCSIEVKMTNPGESYMEIGFLNYSDDKVKNPPKTDYNKFKMEVEAQVCQNGGDLVVPEINDSGEYVGGIVYRKK